MKPKVALPLSADQDQDRLPDDWEREHGLDPNKPDSQEDPDRDKLNNYCELQLGTDPFNSDTDEGGETDGSETGGLCIVITQDPLDPSDDRVGPISSVIAKPELSQSRPVIHVDIGTPSRGDIVLLNIYRRIFSPTNELLQDWTFYGAMQSPAFEDTQIQPGLGYAYLVEPILNNGQLAARTQAMTSTGRIVNSNIAVAAADPYPPSGSIIINHGETTTEQLLVTLSLAVDDSGEAHDGEPATSQSGSPISEIMMRLSNTNEFDGIPWQPFQAEVLDWDLGDVELGQVATVYVQFKDGAGNIGESGFAQVDTIQYRGKPLFLPIIRR